MSAVSGVVVLHNRSRSKASKVVGSVGSPPRKLLLRGSGGVGVLLGNRKTPFLRGGVFGLGSLASWERRDIQQLDLCYDFGKFGENFRQSSRFLFSKKEEVEDEITKSSYCYN